MMRKTKVISIITFALLLLTQNSFAQLVNIEKQRKQIKPGWQGTVDFAFTLNQNTNNILQFSNSINTQYTYHRSTFLILNNITILSVKGQDQKYDLINKNFQHIRYNYSKTDTSLLTYEFFIQRQQNKIKYIKDRFLVGTGLRLRIINNQTVSFYFAPLIMYEYELLTDSAGSYSKMLKGDIYISGYLKITDKIYLSHVTYYQPALFDLGSNIEFQPIRDFRISSETEMSFEIIRNFMEFSLDFQLNYDSRPPVELQNHKLFYTFKNKLTFKF